MNIVVINIKMTLNDDFYDKIILKVKLVNLDWLIQKETCTLEKNNVMLGCILGGLSNNIFISTFTYYIFNKEQLISEVEKVFKSNE